MTDKIILQTPRLWFRRFTSDDGNLLYELDSDPEVMRFINGGVPRTLEETMMQTLPRILSQYDKYEHFGCWAALDRGTDEFIGWFFFRPASDNQYLFRPQIDSEDDIELGYRLKRAYWGRGLATEGSRAIVHRAFTEQGIERVIAWAMKDNNGSRRVLEKTGLKLVEEYRSGDSHNEVVKYALDREEYDDGRMFA